MVSTPAPYMAQISHIYSCTPTNYGTTLAYFHACYSCNDGQQELTNSYCYTRERRMGLQQITSYITLIGSVECILAASKNVT